MTDAAFTPGEPDRARTMAVRALRRLSQTEIVGLGIGLEAIEGCETVLVAGLSSIRAAAEKETLIRKARGIATLGPYGVAYLEIRRTIQRLGLAREDTEQALDVGKVERRVVGE